MQSNSFPRQRAQAYRSQLDRVTPQAAFYPWRIFAAAMAMYLLLATVLSIAQIGYVNSDFVGYATVAHRVLQAPQSSITGYWSPLYPWCMVPLIYLGMDDLIAGRLVLVIAGAIYVLAAFGLVCRFHGDDCRSNRLLTLAMMTVAVLQSATWSTRMLDPDLLADALLFCYFCMVLDPLLSARPSRALLGGFLAGMTALGKAYMLPFTFVHLTATLAIRWWFSRHAGGTAVSARRWAATWALFLAGQALAAGPWGVVLSLHYGKPTFSTAGAANHANMSPAAFGNDPLWNPGLVADFIADPHYGPNWSAFEDGGHFLHQLKVMAYNLNNCLSYVLPWILLGGIFAAVRWRNRVPQAEPRGDDSQVCERHARFGVLWCVVTVLLYVGGYCLINLECRYIVPAMTPVACLAATLVVVGAPRGDEYCGVVPWVGWRASGRWAITVTLLASCQDVHRMVSIPFEHPQSANLARYCAIAAQLRPAGVLPRTFAADHWHDGLLVSYAAGNVSDYLGAPLPDAATSVTEQLRQSGAEVYLRWRGEGKFSPQIRKAMAFVPAAPWTLISTIADGQSRPAVIEVYKLAGSSPERH